MTGPSAVRLHKVLAGRGPGFHCAAGIRPNPESVCLGHRRRWQVPAGRGAGRALARIAANKAVPAEG